MSLCSLFFSLTSILSFYISPWLPLALSAGSLLLFSLSLWAWWSNAQLLDGSQSKTNSKQESKNWRAQRALQQLQIIGPKLWWAAVLLMAGWGLHDIQEYHSTYVLANAAVESQQEVYLSYHYVDDPQRRSYGIKFCSDYVPDLQPRQIIEVMVYARKRGCESIAAYKSGLKIRRLNGVPILEGE